MNLFLFAKDNLDEVVFENRNKQYGAYVLRKSYDSNMLKALGSSLMVMLFIVIAGSMASLFRRDIPPIVELITQPSTTETRFTTIEIELPQQTAATQGGQSETFRIVRNALASTPTTPVTPVTPTSGGGPATGTGEPQTGQTGLPGIAPPIVTPPAPAFVEFASQMPLYPGGEEALFSYLAKQIQYPPQAMENGIEGRVIVSFVIQTDGSIDMLKIEKGLGFGCDEEALRVIRAMPKWNTGMQNGKAVAVKLRLPIFFRLQ